MSPTLSRKSSAVFGFKGLAWNQPFGMADIFPMCFDDLSFCSIRIDGVTYEYDVVFDRGKICRRKKKPSREFREKSDTPCSRPRRKYRGDTTRLVVGHERSVRFTQDGAPVKPGLSKFGSI